MLDSQLQRDGRWILVQRPAVFAVALLLVAIGGCDSVGSDADDSPNYTTEVATQTLKADGVDLDQIDKGQYGNIVDGTRAVLRNQTEYEELWADLHADKSTVPAPPSVDFGSKVVVAIVLGERPNGGYSVEIDGAQVSEDGDQTRIQFTEKVPGCAATQVLTSPYVLATMDRGGAAAAAIGDDAITFEHSEQTRSCTN